MMTRVLLKACVVWLVLIMAESVHGTLRVLLLQPSVGDLRARQIGVLTGSVIVIAVAAGFIRWIRAEASGGLWLVGVLWVALTLGFEVAIGRFVLGYGWDRLVEDYDVTRGGFLAIGMLVVLLSPHIAAAVRGPQRRARA